MKEKERREEGRKVRWRSYFGKHLISVVLVSCDHTPALQHEVRLRETTDAEKCIVLYAVVVQWLEYRQ